LFKATLAARIHQPAPTEYAGLTAAIFLSLSTSKPDFRASEKTEKTTET